MGWSAQFFTTIIIEGNSPNTGIFIYSPAPGTNNLIGSWTATAGIDAFGNSYPQGLFVTAGLLSGVTLNALCSIAGAPIAGSALTGCNYNQGTIKETQITFDTSGGVLLGYGTTTTTSTLTTSGNYTTPAFTAQVFVQGIGGGAGGIWGQHHGAGGGGGEYAAALFTYPASTVIPFTIGNGGAGGTSVITATSGQASNWNSGQLIANGGQVGNGVGGGGLGGNGSTAPVHYQGGNGGNAQTFAGAGGGGGGAAAGPNGTGQSGQNNPTSGSAAGGTGSGGSGNGGIGAAGSNGLGTGAGAGGNGNAPGGGGGGGGNNAGGGGSGNGGGGGNRGQFIASFTATSTLILAISPVAGTDAAGNAFAAGYTGPVQAFQPGVAPTVAEVWHSVTLPSTGGFTGTIRVKLVAEAKFAVLDVQVRWTGLTGTTYSAGSFPSSAYYPTTGTPRFYNMSYGDTPSSDIIGVIIIPASGALQIFTTASGAGSGTGGQYGGTIWYPLD